MAYDLPAFCADLRTILQRDGQRGLPELSEKLAQLLANDAFVEATWDENTPPGKRVLHHDPESDAYVLAHMHPAGRVPGAPHSHGTSWAIYGNARGYTDMTLYERVNPDDADHAELVIKEKYRLGEGETKAYASGAIHSTLQNERAWVVRVTGTDLDVLPRFRFKAERDTLVGALPQ